jgi:hypothetical protein
MMTDEVIEVTPEMIKAGCAELSICESGDPPWSTVRSVYVAMEGVRQLAQATMRRPQQSLSYEKLDAIDMATAMLKRAGAITLEFTSVDNGDGTLTRTAERLIVDP